MFFIFLSKSLNLIPPVPITKQYVKRQDFMQMKSIYRAFSK